MTLAHTALRFAAQFALVAAVLLGGVRPACPSDEVDAKKTFVSSVMSNLSNKEQLRAFRALLVDERQDIEGACRELKFSSPLATVPSPWISSLFLSSSIASSDTSAVAYLCTAVTIADEEDFYFIGSALSEVDSLTDQALECAATAMGRFDRRKDDTPLGMLTARIRAVEHRRMWRVIHGLLVRGDLELDSRKIVGAVRMGAAVVETYAERDTLARVLGHLLDSKDYLGARVEVQFEAAETLQDLGWDGRAALSDLIRCARSDSVNSACAGAIGTIAGGLSTHAGELSDKQLLDYIHALAGVVDDLGLPGASLHGRVFHADVAVRSSLGALRAELRLRTSQRGPAKWFSAHPASTWAMLIALLMTNGLVLFHRSRYRAHALSIGAQSSGHSQSEEGTKTKESLGEYYADLVKWAPLSSFWRTRSWVLHSSTARIETGQAPDTVIMSPWAFNLTQSILVGSIINVLLVAANFLYLDVFLPAGPEEWRALPLTASVAKLIPPVSNFLFPYAIPFYLMAVSRVFAWASLWRVDRTEDSVRRAQRAFLYFEGAYGFLPEILGGLAIALIESAREEHVFEWPERWTQRSAAILVIVGAVASTIWLLNIVCIVIRRRLVTVNGYNTSRTPSISYIATAVVVMPLVGVLFRLTMMATSFGLAWSLNALRAIVTKAFSI